MNKTLIFMCVLLSVVLANCVSAKTVQKPLDRNLFDYKNDNGKPPSGLDTAADDTSAMRKALSAGPGVVRIGPGFYRFSEVSIPAGVTVIGAGTATVIRPAGAKRIIEQKDVDGWAIRDITMDGEAQGDWHSRRDLNEVGIYIERCGGYDVSGVVVRNFNGTGLQITGLNPTYLGGGAGNLSGVTCYQNYTGIHFDVRAEYGNASGLTCYHNITGCIINSGNTKISNSNFGTNVDGLIVEDSENGSHGAISNCLLNHNERYALLCRGVANGMAISDCCIFYGTISIENSAGVNISDGIIGCSISVTGPSANRISGNFMVLEPDRKFNFDKLTIVSENFTKDGLWDRNNR